MNDKEYIQSHITINDNGCWLWKTTPKSRYAQAYKNNRAIPAHRLSYQIYIGEIPKGLFVCHKCDIPGCVNPKHLFVGTQKDNMQDCSVKGRKPPTRIGKNFVRASYQVTREQDDKLNMMTIKTGASKAWHIREAIDQYLKRQKR